MAMDMFIKIEGIPGESRDKAHANEIDVLAWSWGVSNAGSAHVGGGMGTGKANVQDLSFTKYIDSASTALMLRACSGSHIAMATLTVRKAGGDKPVEYLRITLTDIIVTSVASGGSGGQDRLTENVSLNFAKVKVEYTPQDAKGMAGKTQTMSWDIAANAKG